MGGTGHLVHSLTCRLCFLTALLVVVCFPERSQSVTLGPDYGPPSKSVGHASTTIYDSAFEAVSGTAENYVPATNAAHLEEESQTPQEASEPASLTQRALQEEDTADFESSDPFITVGTVTLQGVTERQLQIPPNYPSLVVITSVLPGPSEELTPTNRILLPQIYPSGGIDGWLVDVKLKASCGASPVAEHSPPYLHWMALRPGWFKFLANDLTILVNSTDVNYDGEAHDIPFVSSWHADQIFATPPLVFVQVQSKPDSPDFIHAQVVEVTTEGFKVILQRDEGADLMASRSETVGWVAFDEGGYTLPTGLLTAAKAGAPTDGNYVAESNPAIESQCGKEAFFASPYSRTSIAGVVNQDVNSVEFQLGTMSCTGQIGVFQKDSNPVTVATLFNEPLYCLSVSGGDVELSPVDGRTSMDQVSAAGSNTLVWIIVGSIVGILAVAVLLWFFCRPKREVPQVGQDPSSEQYVGSATGQPQQQWGLPPGGYPPPGRPPYHY